MLVMDNFGIKYINKDGIIHLLDMLKKDYKVDTDWEGTRYLGLTLDRDYKGRRVHLTSSGRGESATQPQLVKTSSTVTELFLYSRHTSKAQINSMASSHSWF